MTLKTIFTAAFAVAILAGQAPAALADDTGVATALHATMRVGGKLCFVDHSHAGNGSGATRKIAEMQAIKSWAGFTAWEYGSDWAKLGKAVKKSMSCSGSGGNWTCDLNATPCK